VKAMRDRAVGRPKDAGGFSTEDTTTILPTTSTSTSLAMSAKTVQAVQSRARTVKSPGAKDAGEFAAADTIATFASATTMTAASLTRKVPATKHKVGTVKPVPAAAGSRIVSEKVKEN
jgi:hypothetical protein